MLPQCECPGHTASSLNKLFIVKMPHRGFWYDTNSLSHRLYSIVYSIVYVKPLFLFCCIFDNVIHNFFCLRDFYPQTASSISAFSSSYSIPIIVSPCAGAVGPAALRSFFSSIKGISSGASSPPPTFISVPAIIRTIL